MAWIRTMAAACAVVLASTVAAQEFKSAADISVKEFFQLAAFREMRLSPDGKRLAAVAPIKDRGNLIIVDLATRKAQALTSSERWDISRINWIGNKLLYFTVVDGEVATGRPRVKGAYTINVDGSGLREVFGYDDRGNLRGLRVVDIFDTEDGDSTVAWVTLRQRSKDYVDVYKLDFKTLRYDLLTFDSPGRTEDWVIDTQHRPRVALRSEPRPETGKPMSNTYWLRGPEDKKYEKIFETSSLHDGETIGLCGFDNDGKTLYLTARRGKDKSTLWSYDTSTKSFIKQLVEDPLVDVACSGDGATHANVTLLREPVTHRVLGVRYDADKLKYQFFDKGAEALFAKLQATLPGEVWYRFAREGDRALVTNASDTNAGDFYLFSKDSSKLESIASSRPWFKPAQMAERKFITYKARDGLVIPAYLTLPRGTPANKLPLIVNIHGGPQVRGYEWASWGRWPEAQFFASRGYAVLEPEPRSSKGWGLKHFTAGFKQWGLTMQDDITDGALHLVSEGIVDRERMCLHGGSYGGYATLQGLVKEPDLFKCGNAFIAVSDLGLLQNVAWSDTAQDLENNYFANEFTYWVGDSKRDAAQFAQTSPARHADQIKAPLMLTMGSDDRRVPLIHGTTMRDAMVKAGKPVEWKVYPEEGHGFNKEENVIDFYTRSLRLFDRTIGPDRPGASKASSAANPAPK